MEIVTTAAVWPHDPPDARSEPVLVVEGAVRNAESAAPEIRWMNLVHGDPNAFDDPEAEGAHALLCQAAWEAAAGRAAAAA